MNTDPSGTPALPSIPGQRDRSADGTRCGGSCGPSPLDVPAQRVRAIHSVPNQVAHETPWFVRDHDRSEVLHRHARLGNGGRPIFCTPSRAELAGVVALRQSRGTDGKVIYDTREAAEAAARELEALGARHLRSYLCGRSRSGHFHLATATRSVHVPAQRPSGQSAPCLHDRIPQQRGPLSA